jgi:urease accessory protein
VLQARSWLPRTEGTLRLGFVRRGGRTVLDVLHQAGAARVRFPNPDEGAPPEAVLLNTAGGLTGGDRIDQGLGLGEGAQATVTTAAAEKIYRASDGDASIRVKLRLGAGASLAWLPQPTILFDQSRLDRRTEVELAGDARLLAVEMLVFGRMAMGEDVHRGAVRDAWRVRRDGSLAWADTFRVEGAVAAAFDRPGTLAGARAAGMILYAAPDAATRLDQARALLQSAGGKAGASTWNGVLIVRALAPDAHTLQRVVAPLAETLSGRALPRVWQC